MEKRPGMTARLLQFREIAPEVCHLVFEIEDSISFSYVPGQFASLTADINGSPITRAYSFASPACGARIELCLNRVPEGKFSPYLFKMQPGDRVQMTGPWGGFIFRQPVEDSILVATGTGIVPFRAMLQDQLSRDSEEFEQLARDHPNFHFRPTLSRPEPGWTGRTGHVQAHLFEAVGDRRDVNVFICGLKVMVDDVRSILKSSGFDRKRIICEKYD
jgi:NAD(P)H-flavin reductase